MKTIRLLAHWFGHPCPGVAAVIALLATTLPSPLTAQDSTAATPSAPADVSLPAYTPPSDPRELLKIDDTMRHFFSERISAAPGTATRLREIVDAILLPSGLNFAYDAEATLEPRETFRERRGNCVGFSLLVVAIAREFGFEATFQNVDDAAKWNKYGVIVASVLHLNVRVATDDGVYIVDLRPDLLPSLRLDVMREIRDERAFSQFYSNIGFFRLVHGDPAAALRYMILATDVDPAFGPAWTNRANMHARFGDLANARACFERSLRVRRGDYTAVVGLVDVLHRIATPEALKAAEKLERRAQAMRDRNPYYHQYLAERDREREDWLAAEKELKRAIDLKDDEPEFYVELIAVLHRLARDSEEKRIERKLERLRTRLANVSVHFGSAVPK
ncbi:MAG TPA: transglutaminase domain-containing protein [Opitutaceae bacterium]|nr:transglutaminase domain-containing protein [Opitutaceae bacterium]